MRFQELDRGETNGEVRSTYEVGNLTIHLTSRFNGKVTLEDAMYQIILQRLRSQEKSEGRQCDNGHIENEAV